MLSGRKILLAVTGGIAAYKACELVRLLTKHGASVQVLMTEAATHFVNPLTFEALSGRKVALDMFAGEEPGQSHLDIVRDANLMVIAPSTANSIAKLACGIADDLMGTAALALGAPLLICPAMNPRMFWHPAVQENLMTLRRRGVHVMDPAEGPMAHPLEEPGWGRLPEGAEILDRICRLLPPQGPLSGAIITITAGPTQEALDPVRYLSNYSSGRMGFALAEEARRRGADVRLISGPSALPPPPGVDVFHIASTAQLQRAVNKHFHSSKALIMAAAPADFQPQKTQTQKIKKPAGDQGLSIHLQKTPDILQRLGRKKGSRVLVGFALETERGVENARLKLKQKNLDLIVLNHPRPAAGAGMGENAIQATLISAKGPEEVLPVMSKGELAALILDRLTGLLVGRKSA